MRLTRPLLVLMSVLVLGAQLLPAQILAISEADKKAVDNDTVWYGSNCDSQATGDSAAAGTGGGGSATPSGKYIAIGNIPKEGIEYGASIYGGAYEGGKWVPHNGVQGGGDDDTGIGNHDNKLPGTTTIAELSNSPGSGDFSALGNIPNGTKLEITYKGKTIIASKDDVGDGGDAVNGKKRAVDLWWETARLLNFKDGTDVVTVHAVDKNTPVTPVNGSAAAAAVSDTAAANCCNVSETSDTPVNGDSNLQIIFNYFVSKGYSKEQAAGIAGNVYGESSGSPERYQGDEKDYKEPPGSDLGWGIVQWTPNTKITEYAKTVNKHAYKLTTQMEFLWKQLEGTSPNNAEKAAGDQLKAAKTVEEATAAFQNGYERPADKVGSLGKRTAKARQVLTDYGASAPAASSDAGTTSDTAASGSDGCCPPVVSGDGGDSDGAPSDWKKMYTGANKAKSEAMGRGKLTDPKILIIHFTQGHESGQELLDYFASSGGTTGVQFNVDEKGQISQYFPLNNMQRTNQAFSANSKAIGIEISGHDSNDLMGNTKQFESVVALSKYLCDHFDIPCADPKGYITGTNDIEKAQGMLGHDETPTNDHTDPDAIIKGADTSLNPVTKQTWGDADYKNSDVHVYMKKLRTAMGFNPTPGKDGKSSDKATGSAADSAQCGNANADNAGGDGTSKDHVGAGPNKALALEAVKYDTKTNKDKYVYVWGGLHGALSELKDFAKNGGGVDCSGFIRYIIWKTYGTDIGGLDTQGFPSSKYFKEIKASEAQAGDVGWREEHVDFITENKGNGKLHQFGAHSTATDLYGGDTTAGEYTRFYRYIGPKSSSGGGE